MNKQKTLPTINRRQTLMIMAVALVLVYILWNNPFQLGIISTIMTPLRLFVTYVHEASHSVMTLLTGGQVVGFVVFEDGSGVATRIGGNSLLVSPAGYIGTAFFGSLLFVLVNRVPRYIDAIALILGIAMIGFTLMFARNLLTIALGVGFGGLLMFLGAKVNLVITLLVLNVLSVITALNAVIDATQLVTVPQFATGMILTDAAIFQKNVAPFLPVVVIGASWALISLAIFGAAVYYGIWKPIRQEVDTAYQTLTS
jgi:hypothetical protein